MSPLLSFVGKAIGSILKPGTGSDASLNGQARPDDDRCGNHSASARGSGLRIAAAFPASFTGPDDCKSRGQMSGTSSGVPADIDPTRSHPIDLSMTSATCSLPAGIDADSYATRSGSGAVEPCPSSDASVQGSGSPPRAPQFFRASRASLSDTSASAAGEALRQASMTNRNANFTRDNLVAYMRWVRASRGAMKLARKGASRGPNPTLLLRCEHWLEVTDEQHRYGSNLRVYFDYWVAEMEAAELTPPPSPALMSPSPSHTHLAALAQQHQQMQLQQMQQQMQQQAQQLSQLPLAHQAQQQQGPCGVQGGPLWGSASELPPPQQQQEPQQGSGLSPLPGSGNQDSEACRTAAASGREFGSPVQSEPSAPPLQQQLQQQLQPDSDPASPCAQLARSLPEGQGAELFQRGAPPDQNRQQHANGGAGGRSARAHGSASASGGAGGSPGPLGAEAGPGPGPSRFSADAPSRPLTLSSPDRHQQAVAQHPHRPLPVNHHHTHTHQHSGLHGHYGRQKHRHLHWNYTVTTHQHQQHQQQQQQQQQSDAGDAPGEQGSGASQHEKQQQKAAHAGQHAHHDVFLYEREGSVHRTTEDGCGDDVLGGCAADPDPRASVDGVAESEGSAVREEGEGEGGEEGASPRASGACQQPQRQRQQQLRRHSCGETPVLAAPRPAAQPRPSSGALPSSVDGIGEGAERHGLAVPLSSSISASATPPSPSCGPPPFPSTSAPSMALQLSAASLSRVPSCGSPRRSSLCSPSKRFALAAMIDMSPPEGPEGGQQGGPRAPDPLLPFQDEHPSQQQQQQSQQQPQQPHHNPGANQSRHPASQSGAAGPSPWQDRCDSGSGGACPAAAAVAAAAAAALGCGVGSGSSGDPSVCASGVFPATPPPLQQRLHGSESGVSATGTAAATTGAAVDVPAVTPGPGVGPGGPLPGSFTAQRAAKLMSNRGGVGNGSNFFRWLDNGPGLEVDLAHLGVSRAKLDTERVKYLTPKELLEYELDVEMDTGLLRYKRSGKLLHTGPDGRGSVDEHRRPPTPPPPAVPLSLLGETAAAWWRGSGGAGAAAGMTTAAAGAGADQQPGTPTQAVGEGYGAGSGSGAGVAVLQPLPQRGVPGCVSGRRNSGGGAGVALVGGSGSCRRLMAPVPESSVVQVGFAQQPQQQQQQLAYGLCGDAAIEAAAAAADGVAKTGALARQEGSSCGGRMGATAEGAGAAASVLSECFGVVERGSGPAAVGCGGGAEAGGRGLLDLGVRGHSASSLNRVERTREGCCSPRRAGGCGQASSRCSTGDGGSGTGSAGGSAGGSGSGSGSRPFSSAEAVTPPAAGDMLTGIAALSISAGEPSCGGAGPVGGTAASRGDGFPCLAAEATASGAADACGPSLRAGSAGDDDDDGTKVRRRLMGADVSAAAQDGLPPMSLPPPPPEVFDGGADAAVLDGHLDLPAAAATAAAPPLPLPGLDGPMPLSAHPPTPTAKPIAAAAGGAPRTPAGGAATSSAAAGGGGGGVGAPHLHLHHEEKVTKWIYVVDPELRLFVHPKVRGRFHHSSFLRGGAVVAAGGLAARHGRLRLLTADSGHYWPREENFRWLCEHLVSVGADLSSCELRSKHMAVPAATGKELMERMGVPPPAWRLQYKFQQAAEAAAAAAAAAGVAATGGASPPSSTPLPSDLQLLQLDGGPPIGLGLPSPLLQLSEASALGSPMMSSPGAVRAPGAGTALGGGLSEELREHERD